MASSQDDESEWDKSTSEVQSEDSEDLFEARPNRWRGPPQSWRSLTEEDRLTHNALDRLRNQDLSVHLYNSFALRKTSQAVQQDESSSGEQVVDIDADTGQPVLNRPWAPPKSWTAWPLRAALVPPDDFMKRTEDEDEAFTFRRLERETPSSKLEEVVSAAILRCAKEKFRTRSFDEAQEKPAQENSSIEKEPLSSGNETESEGEKMDLGAAPAPTPKQRMKGDASQRSFKPAVSTDDDASYELIRPSARSILERLDRALGILHNARMTSAQSLVDAANASSSGDESLYDEATPGRPSRSRATSRARSASRASTNTARNRSRSASREVGESLRGGTPADPARPKSNRGRKSQSRPREGETEREFLIRRAKEQKKKRPVFPDGDGGDGQAAAEPAGDDAKSPARRRQRGRRESRTGDGDGYWARKRLARLGLRDWSDVMGAAALAGFVPRVVERATQRCADLFGEGMDMHTIAAETAASPVGAGVDTRRYLPGGEISSSESDADDEGGHLDLRQARSISRRSSAAPSRTASRAASPSLGREDGHTPDSPRKRQKRSVSRGSAAGAHYCPHVDCERAYRGFDRPFNLKRHLKLVHGGEGPSELDTKGVETGDLLGGVHRDGFLEPIRMQKGWRAADVKKRAKKRTPVKRRRDESFDEEDSRSEDDSTESPSGSEKV